MNIYLFRSYNKLLFLTSSFVGWLIGHIFLMKCIGLILLVWSKQKKLIKSKLTMRFDKYILLQLRDYVGQMFVVFSFVIFAHYLPFSSVFPTLQSLPFASPPNSQTKPKLF